MKKIKNEEIEQDNGRALKHRCCCLLLQETQKERATAVHV